MTELTEMPREEFERLKGIVPPDRSEEYMYWREKFRNAQAAIDLNAGEVCKLYQDLGMNEKPPQALTLNVWQMHQALIELSQLPEIFDLTDMD